MSSSPRPGSGATSGRPTDFPHSHHDDPQSSSTSTSPDPSSSGSSSRLPSPSALLPPLGPPISGPSDQSPSAGAGAGTGNGNANGNGNRNGHAGSGNSKPGGPIYANELLDPELFANHSHHTTSKRHPIPEKCLTFCSQSQENQPICRMFCLRRRRAIMSQEEQIARLRPTSASHRAYNQSQSQSQSQSHPASSSTSSIDSGTSTDPAVSEEGNWSESIQSKWRWNPFKALERKMNPWSFIYVKGSPEGVVGRYMEELEGDDGNNDFGSISRNATDLQRRKSPGGMEYIDWGEHGSLLHLPLTSLLAPIIRLPENISRVFAPSVNLLNLYQTSFNDGSQSRNLSRLTSELTNGGAFTFFGKLNSHYRKKINERKEEIMKQREKLREETERALVNQKDKLIREKMEKYESVRKEQEE